MFLHFPFQIFQLLQVAIDHQVLHLRICNLEASITCIIDFNPHCSICIEGQFGL